MKKSGIAKAFLGLVLGLLVGLSILALKAYVSEQIVDLLETEVAASCPGCHFAVDSVSLSFLRLKAVAQRPRIVENGKTALQFQRIEVAVSIKKISSHVVELSRLDLFQGEASGVGPDSPTFRFIDHLTEPIAPERDRPGRWKARLESLYVHNSRFTEHFSRSDLVGEGVAMSVLRDQKDDFWLAPTVEKLRVASRSDPAHRPFELGKLAGKIRLGEGLADFQNLRLALAKSWIEVSGLAHTHEDNRLEGTVSLDVDSQSYALPSWLAFKISGDGKAAGTLGKPDFSGTFKENAKPAASVLTSGKPRAEFDAFGGEYSVRVRRGDSEAAATKLEARGPSASLSLTSPLSIHNEDVAGEFDFSAESMHFDDVSLYGLKGSFALSGKDYDIRLVSRGQAAAAVSHGFTFRALTYSLSLQNDEMDVSFSHQSTELGSVSAHGKVRMNEEPARILGIDFQYSDFALFQPLWPSSESVSILDSLRFSGAGTVKGPLSVGTAEATASFSLASTSLLSNPTFQGSADLRSGNLKVIIDDKGKSLHSTLTFPLASGEKSHLSLQASHVRPEDLFPSLECLDFSGDAEYSFDPQAPWVGTGEFKINGLQFGCAQYAVALENAANIKINAGNASLAPATFKGLESSVLLQGDVSALKGFNLNAQGKLELNSLVALLPSVDDLSGQIVAALDLKGPVTAPNLTGRASVRKAEFSIESANISASDITGDLVLQGQTVSIQNLAGNLNGGSAQLRGEWLPMEPEKSTLVLTASGVSLDPFPNTTLQIGGELQLKKPSSGIPAIEGVIHVEGGEFQKNLEVANLIRAISDAVFKSAARSAQSVALPRVDLNVSITATRNLFMYTNWAGAEFRGDLSVTGDINAPAINGTVESISGWFGIRDRRFEITSGTLTFRAGAPQPTLEIIGETYVPSYTGDSILIIAEARGPITNPKISFSSDRGLSEREILNLLAIGANRSGQTLANTASRGLELQSETLFDEFSTLSIQHILSNLTKINSLSIQPTYNVQTGLIEPEIVAEKKITDRLALIGESTLGGTATEARLQLLYDLTSYMKLAGIAESVSTRQKSALGADLTYTVLAKQREFVKIALRGNKHVDRLKLLKGIRLSVNSRVPVSDLPRLGDAARDFYHSLGYLDATASATCEASDRFCRQIVFSINEGDLHYVSMISIDGDDISSAVDTKKVIDVSKHTVASEETLAAKRDGLTKRLRAEGFISARVNAVYENTPETNQAALVLTVKAGKPVSFVFNGNNAFSAEDFLDTINLFDRKQPFGNNTINILTQNIERKYREAGYLYATIGSTKVEEPASNRITYIIDINEDSKAEVERVVFSGNNSLSTEQLSKLSTDLGIEGHENIFSPKFAVAEVLEQNVAALKNLYIEQGYPQIEISYQINPLDQADKIEIKYVIVEGSEVRADWLAVEGFPSGAKMPHAPPAPYSIPKANRYIDELLDVLKDRGYLQPALWSDINADTEQMTIHVEPGTITRIGEVELEGNEGIDKRIIQRNLAVVSGDPWDNDKINESKRKLLRLGLFSRVEISPVDGALNQPVENMVIRVSERPLTTLEIGGGVNSEFGLHMFGEATDRDLFRDGRTLSLRADLYYDPASNDISQGVAGLRYADPYFMSSSFSHAEELRFEKLDLSTLEFNLDRVSLLSYLYRSWDQGFSASFGHTIMADDVTNVPDDAQLSSLDSGNVKISFLSAVFSYDRRDNPLNPQKGYNLNLDLKLAEEALFSDANYYSLGGRASYTLPLPATRFSFAFSTRAASAWAFGGTDEIPITQRYYLGGRNSVRGFKENSLGPRGESGSILGGDMLLAGSTEARYLVRDNLSVHWFVDAGNVFLRGSDASSYSLRYSTGLGMRFLSPIGPIGFDIGHPLESKNGEPSWRFHFNIGTNF